MLVLSRLQDSLRQVLVPPSLHTAVLLTPSGQLVSFASYPSRAKDEIRVIAGLSGEVWQETHEQGAGMVDSEMGRIVVLPVDEPAETRAEQGPQPAAEEYQPLMLLVLNATGDVEWDVMQSKVCLRLVRIIMYRLRARSRARRWQRRLRPRWPSSAST
ncbi:hypothetical protein B0H11DRAFT_1703831 [Mycena galericulata]|nr:hypothetical protein B0H11DRAFT_1703831 [Mycena galericulata]